MERILEAALFWFWSPSLHVKFCVKTADKLSYNGLDWLHKLNIYTVLLLLQLTYMVVEGLNILLLQPIYMVVKGLNVSLLQLTYMLVKGLNILLLQLTYMVVKG